MDILNPPKQARSRATLARLERAAIELIAEKGPDGANVQDITRRARSSVGSFYARFDGKDELMAYLRARVWQDVQDRWDESGNSDREIARIKGFEGADPENDGLSAALYLISARVIQAFEPDARARRVLETHRGPEDPEDLAGLLVEHLATETSARLAEYTAEIDHPNPQVAVRLLLAVLVASARELTETESLNVLRGALGLPELPMELWRMAIGYLHQRSGATAFSSQDPPAQMEFFDVWG